MIVGATYTPPKPKMGIETLSNEILIQVMEFLTTPNADFIYPPNFLETKDLLSLMCCAKLFVPVGESILYRTFIQTGPGVLAKFIRATIARPELLSYVQRAQFRFLEEPPKPTNLLGVLKSYGAGLGASIYTSSEYNTIKTHINSSCIPENIARLWLRKLTTGDWAAETALLISMLPDVQEVRITNCIPQFNDATALLRLALSISVYRSSSSRLKSLAMTCQEPHYYRDVERIKVESIADILTNTPLERFECRNLREGAAEDTGGDPNPIPAYGWKNLKSGRKFLLKELRLVKCNLGAGTLRSLLLACPELEKVTYEHEQFCREHIFVADHFMESIAHLKPQLRELAVYRQPKGVHHGSSSYCGVAELRVIGSFADFKNLRKLSITSHMLLDPLGDSNRLWSPGISSDTSYIEPILSQILPASLEVLRLHDCHVEKVAPHILELLDHKSLFPNLNQIVLGFCTGLWFGSTHENSVSPFFISDTCVTPWEFTCGRGSRTKDRDDMSEDEKVRELAEQDLVKEMEMRCWEFEVELVMVNIVSK